MKSSALFRRAPPRKQNDQAAHDRQPD